MAVVVGRVVVVMVVVVMRMLMSVLPLRVECLHYVSDLEAGSQGHWSFLTPAVCRPLSLSDLGPFRFWLDWSSPGGSRWGWSPADKAVSLQSRVIHRLLQGTVGGSDQAPGSPSPQSFGARPWAGDTEQREPWTRSQKTGSRSNFCVTAASPFASEPQFPLSCNEGWAGAEGLSCLFRRHQDCLWGHGEAGHLHGAALVTRPGRPG